VSSGDSAWRRWVARSRWTCSKANRSSCSRSRCRRPRAPSPWLRAHHPRLDVRRPARSRCRRGGELDFSQKLAVKTYSGSAKLPSNAKSPLLGTSARVSVDAMTPPRTCPSASRARLGSTATTPARSGTSRPSTFRMVPLASCLFRLTGGSSPGCRELAGSERPPEETGPTRFWMWRSSPRRARRHPCPSTRCT